MKRVAREMRAFGATSAIAATDCRNRRFDLGSVARKARGLGARMPIYKLLADDNAFESGDIERMTAAYEAALTLVQLKGRDDPLTELIAKKIIETYSSGVRDPARVCATALKELGVNPRDQ